MTGSQRRPAVLVYRHPEAPSSVLRQICAGAEEDGVPTEVVDTPAVGGATALAHAAAQASRLEVGIGLDASGAAAVSHGKLPVGHPAATAGPGATSSEARRIGRIGARVVKGLPLE